MHEHRIADDTSALSCIAKYTDQTTNQEDTPDERMVNGHIWSEKPDHPCFASGRKGHVTFPPPTGPRSFFSPTCLPLPLSASSLALLPTSRTDLLLLHSSQQLRHGKLFISNILVEI